MIYPINHLPDCIPVGVQTDSGVEAIGFDLKPWLDALPGMAFTVWPTRPGESEAYPANVQEMVGTVLYWYPDGYDTERAGAGRVEIAGVSDGKRKAFGYVATAVRPTSLAATKEPGEGTAPWYESVLNTLNGIYNNVDVGDGGLYLVSCDYRVEGSVKKYSDRTQEEIRAAVAAGKTCLLVNQRDGRVYTYYAEEVDTTEEPYNLICPTFVSPLRYERGTGLYYWQAQVHEDGYVSFNGNSKARTPNPYKLTIGGQAYDGSEAVTLEIPSGGSGAIVISATTTTASDGTQTAVLDGDPAETLVALKAGKTVVCDLESYGQHVIIPCINYNDFAMRFAVYMVETAVVITWAVSDGATTYKVITL